MAATDKDKIRSKEVLKTLGFAGKVQYIWDYYKLVLVLIVAAIAIIIYFTYRFLHPDPEYILDVTLVEGATPIDDTGNVFEQYMDDNGYDRSEQDISVVVMESTTYTTQLLMARLMTGEIDMMTGDVDIMDMLYEGQALLELEDLVSAELLEEYADCLYWAEDPDTGEEHVYAIQLKDGNALMQQAYYAENVYVCIAYTAEHVETGISVMEYLLEYGE